MPVAFRIGVHRVLSEATKRANPSDPTSSIMMHLDFLVTDRAATEARVLAAGATKLDFQPNSGQCFVYADPAGHPFCLTTWDGAVPPGHDPM